RAATPPYTFPTREQRVIPGQLGTGVEISTVRRIRDELLDKQLRNAMGEAGFWEEREDALSRVEAIFPEPTEQGLQGLIGKFFNNWHELNNSPQDLGLKAAVRVAGEELTVAVRQAYSQLKDNERNLRELAQDQVDKINSIAEEISGLNQRIQNLIRMGTQPNDLMDRRDILLDQLGTIGTETVERFSDGTISVSLFGQELIREDGTYETVSIQAPFGGPSDSLILSFSSGATVDITAAANAYSQSGSLVGIESSRQKVKEYMTDLDDLANTIRDEVNTAHGSDFFDTTSLGAADFDLSDAVKADLNNIDGTRALAVAGLRDDLIMAGGTATFEGFYRQLVTRIGEDMRGSGERTTGAQAVREQLQKLRESVSGVSVDEELTKLTQYQYAFQACSRVITIIDDMLDTLINRMLR
ncbi:MAG: flagellar hook-associated protein FlgK, partial [Firmicutes bacterium]|nr:flagellar hook-associated protein FlgK [Bacillota bacterium]